MAPTPNNLVVIFRNHMIPNEAASRAAGRPIASDLEVCEIRFPGDRQKVNTFPAHDAEPNATRLAGSDRHPEYSGFPPGQPVTYAMLYNEQYRRFKSGEAQSQSGTPLEELTFLTQAKRYELKALNVHTAEALASLDGLPLKQLGPGGREMKNQAQAYLDNAAGSADVESLVSEVADLRAQLAEERAFREKFVQRTYSREQKEQERLIGADKFNEQEAAKAAAEEAEEAEQAEEAQPAPKKKTAAKVEVEAKKVEIPDDRNADFNQWDHDQLLAYVTQETGQRPRGNPSTATLIAAATELRGGK